MRHSEVLYHTAAACRMRFAIVLDRYIRDPAVLPDRLVQLGETAIAAIRDFEEEAARCSHSAISTTAHDAVQNADLEGTSVSIA
jgi:hypothetical protein